MNLLRAGRRAHHRLGPILRAFASADVRAGRLDELVRVHIANSVMLQATWANSECEFRESVDVRASLAVGRQELAGEHRRAGGSVALVHGAEKGADAPIDLHSMGSSRVESLLDSVLGQQARTLQGQVRPNPVRFHLLPTAHSNQRVDCERCTLRVAT